MDIYRYIYIRSLRRRRRALHSSTRWKFKVDESRSENQGWRNYYRGVIDSLRECEHSNPDSLEARLFPFVVLAVAPAVVMDDASSSVGWVGGAKSTPYV